MFHWKTRLLELPSFASPGMSNARVEPTTVDEPAQPAVQHAGKLASLPRKASLHVGIFRVGVRDEEKSHDCFADMLLSRQALEEVCRLSSIYKAYPGIPFQKRIRRPDLGGNATATIVDIVQGYSRIAEGITLPTLLLAIGGIRNRAGKA